MHKVFATKKWWITIILIIYVALFFLERTNLAASDLGRHVTNGRVIWQTGSVFHTNLYSYTNPDFPVPNHHWLFGVIVYLLHQVGGFSALTVMGAVLYTTAIVLIFYASSKKAGFYPALAAVLLALPLFTDRAETRPEAFSLFFFTVFYLLFAWIVEQKKLTRFWYVCLTTVVVMALWINTHIFFVLTGILGVAAAVHGYWNKLPHLWVWMGSLASALLLGAFINPVGWQLVVYPLSIFSNYGYRVSENQPLWFFLQHYTRPIHWYLVFFILLFITLNIFYLKKRLASHLYLVLISGFFLLFTIKLIRIENIFAVTAIPLLTLSLSAVWQKYHLFVKEKLNQTLTMMSLSIVGFIAIAAILGSGLFFPFKGLFGVGLSPGYEQSIAFISNFPITGRIFNNFDSGSFLIYSLYPNQQVFIDNRAEAYPASFIQDTYLQAQQDETVWYQLEQQYHFATIIFYRHEQTNWGQEFLVKRIQDPSWIPVYVDNYLIMFLKDTPANEELIEQYRLPQEMFSIVDG